jgi:hypothetical protein
MRWFGHALYESLSVGRPIITSQFTPWQNLQQQQAGININIQQPVQNIATQIDSMAALQNALYQLFCKGALQLANNYYYQQNFQQQYQQVFSI